MVLVTPNFFSSGNWTQNDYIPGFAGQRYEDRLAYLQNLASNGQAENKTRWANLSVAECSEYTAYESGRGSLLYVSNGNYSHVSNTSSVDVGNFSADGQNSVHDYSFRSPEIIAYHYWLSHPKDFPVSYCLSLKVSHHCRLQLHLWLLLAVVVLNMLGITCFLASLNDQRGPPLLTLGDAIASFLKSPDTMTSSKCLLSEE